jgi:hypothetical protein
MNCAKGSVALVGCRTVVVGEGQNGHMLQSGVVFVQRHLQVLTGKRRCIKDTTSSHDRQQGAG